LVTHYGWRELSGNDYGINMQFDGGDVDLSNVVARKELDVPGYSVPAALALQVDHIGANIHRCYDGYREAHRD
jgi:hypothetical protein